MLELKESAICTECFLKLPQTLLWEEEAPTQLDMVFSQFKSFAGATAIWHYRYDNPIRKLMHMLKYHNKIQAGVFFGKILARIISSHYPHWNFSCVVPMPITTKRLLKRGFNQARIIANYFVSEYKRLTGKSVSIIQEHAILRTEMSKPQSTRKLSERFEMSPNTFKVTTPEIIRNQSLLIIDDVITTGVSISTLITALERHYPASIYVACICWAKRYI